VSLTIPPAATPAIQGWDILTQGAAETICGARELRPSRFSSVRLKLAVDAVMTPSSDGCLIPRELSVSLPAVLRAYPEIQNLVRFSLKAFF
jgi:hypothetical protein